MAYQQKCNTKSKEAKMNSLLRLDTAKTCSRMKGKTVAGIYTRGNMLYVRKRIGGKLIPYSTGKKDTEVNRKWVEYHSEAIWQDKHTKVEQEVLLHEAEPTLEEYGLEYYKSCPDSRDTTTHGRLLYDFKQYILPKLGKYKLSELTVSSIEVWQAEMRYYPNPVPGIADLDKVKPTRGYSRVKNLRSALTLVLNKAVHNRKLDYSPADHVPLVKNERKKKISISIEEAESLTDDDLEDIFVDETVTYTEEDIKYFVKICDHIISEKKAIHHKHVWQTFKQLMIFKFYTGVRSGEAIALMWKFVHFDTKKIDIRFTMREGEIKLPKEEKVRTIDMFPAAEKALRKLYELSGHSSWVFLSQNREKPYVNPYCPSRL